MGSNDPIIVGHRGASGHAPENTLISFEKALKLGVTQIETDLRLTSDGVVVLLHNPNIHDASGNSLTVVTSSFQALKAHRPDLVTLDEAIRFVNRQVRLMLEVKADVPTEQIIKIVKSYLRKGWQPTDFMFASFDYKVLKQLHTALPEIERVVLAEWFGVRAIYRARKLNTRYLSMDQRWVWWGFVRLVTHHHYKLFTYPHRTSYLPLNHKRPDKWAKHGLHGIITDYPDYFMSHESAIVETYESQPASHRTPNP
jgi:glycerophosphoryl diester phosphodiesterase